MTLRQQRWAGLRRVSDRRPGIVRRRRGRGFSYSHPSGRPVRDAATLARIRAIAIPPAWVDVWICPSPDGHLQASGRDARGRKQYRYHAAWRLRRDRAKFGRMVAFAEALPRIRSRVDRDLRRPGLPRDRVLAAVVRLLDRTALRVGNDEYARANGSFGLTTLRKRHARVTRSTVTLRFRGKAGRIREVRLTDRRLARLIGRCLELPGRDLFGYLDDEGQVRDVRSADVNAYLRETAGDGVSAKDFRTWAGTLHAYRWLRATASSEDAVSARRVVVAAVKATAEELGNTPAVTRAAYIHPAVIEALERGAVAGGRRRSAVDERAVIALLRGAATSG